MSTSAITPSTSSVNISSVLAATVGSNTPGIDVNAAVAAALYAARAPERGWQADQATLSTQTTVLTAIQTATQAVQTDIQSLNSLTGPLATRAAASSNTNILSATAANGTVTGSHTLVVGRLASSGAWYSDVAASATATLPTSSLSLTNPAGTTLTIATGTGAAGDNLNDLASTINGDSSLGVTASVVSDSSGSRLAIVANASGAAGNFSITSANYTGTAWKSADIPPGDTLGANSFTLTVGGTTTTISTTSGETYAQVASNINGMNLGVTATAGSDANGTTLSIASTDGTTPFTISEPSFAFTQSTIGANASLTVDGVPITSASNTVTGAIAGVSVKLVGAAPGVPVTLVVATNASQVSSTINQFVSDYNTAIGLVNAQFRLAGGSNSEGILSSDSTIVNLQSTLESTLNYAATPAAGSTTTTVTTLSDLGISVANDGTVSVDNVTLASALTSNPIDVQNFFEGSALNGFANHVYAALNTFTNPANGAFTVDLSGFSATNNELTTEIKNFETNYIASQQAHLIAEYSSAEIALQQLPQQMAQIQAELGVTPTKSG